MDAILVFELINKTHNTADLEIAEFDELVRATLFYLRGGHSPERTAELVIEEIFPMVVN